MSSGLAELALRDARLAHVHLAHWAPAALVSTSVTIAVDLARRSQHRNEYRADFIAIADIIFLSAAQLADPVCRPSTWYAEEESEP